jgi:glycosyltransferase involved in cell wall biosynthesis
MTTTAPGRIGYIAPRYIPTTGGVQTHVAQLARRAAAHGYHVEVLTQESDCSLPAVEVIDGVTVRRFPVWGHGQTYTMAPGLWAYLARHHTCYDVVHAHSYHAVPALGAALAGCRPLVFTPHYHGTGHSCLRRWLHGPYRAPGAAIFRRSSRVICVSDAEAALVRRHFPHVAGRVTVIPNGVDVRALREAVPYLQERTVILSVGRLEAYKNVHLAIQALAHLDATFVLRVIGDGPAWPALEDLVTRLGLQERVGFLGRVDDIRLHRWFRTAAVYVSMSGHEAFGITLLEALAAGSGVVVADIPAYREIARRTGSPAVALVPLNTRPVALARVIRDTAARGAQITVMPRLLSWDEVAVQTISVYRAVVRPSVRCKSRC